MKRLVVGKGEIFCSGGFYMHPRLAGLIGVVCKVKNPVEEQAPEIVVELPSGETVTASLVGLLSYRKDNHERAVLKEAVHLILRIDSKLHEVAAALKVLNIDVEGEADLLADVEGADNTKLWGIAHLIEVLGKDIERATEEERPVIDDLLSILEKSGW